MIACVGVLAATRGVVRSSTGNLGFGMGAVEHGDVELLDAWKRGDTVAGNTLVQRHFDALFRFFRSRVDDGVPDLVQQTFLACVESPQRIPEEVGFRAWLFGIARNKLLLRHRGERRREHAMASGKAAPDELDESVGGWVGMREEQRLLLRALRRLPEDLQVALVLSYWEGLSSVEVAAVLEVPVGTVKSRLRRARDMLKEVIVQLAPNSVTAAVTARDLDAWARALRESLSRNE